MRFTNNIISYLITKINHGTKKRLRFIKLEYNETVLDLLKILYEHGVIRSYRIQNNNEVDVYIKYHESRPIIRMSIVSTSGKRVFWNLDYLTKYYNNHNFSGFFVISTKSGLHTSHDCLINRIDGGEVLMKVEV